MPDPEFDAMTPLRAVWHERVKQDAKWGEQNHDDCQWLAILTEELGEAAQCVVRTALPPIGDDAQAYCELLDYELVQVAAVAVAWLECRRRRAGLRMRHPSLGARPPR